MNLSSLAASPRRLSAVAAITAALLAAPPFAAAASPSPEAAVDPALTTALAGSWRTPKQTARDGYRHPADTLTFFGLKPDQTVIEVWPGGGWYTDVLAPYLRPHGHYIGAVNRPSATADGAEAQRDNDALRTKLASRPEVYGPAAVVEIDPAAPAFGAPGSADLVLTFRNVHNWRMAGRAEAMFKGFYAVLKPGGTLGVVEHRAAKDVPADDKSGYVGQNQVIAMAQAAGFRLAAQSEVNANPKDTKDYPEGVWTLPPALTLKDKDREKYLAIGESDRMTLRFVKPAR